MDPKEFKIGNLFFDNDIKRNYQIESIFTKCNKYYISYENGMFKSCIDVSYNSVHLIPLTEEWLLNMGFKEYSKDHLTLDVLTRGIIHVYLSKTDVSIELGNKSGYSFGYPNVKYVHQLQNLYFALTGKELTIINQKS